MLCRAWSISLLTSEFSGNSNEGEIALYVIGEGRSHLSCHLQTLSRTHPLPILYLEPIITTFVALTMHLTPSLLDNTNCKPRALEPYHNWRRCKVLLRPPIPLMMHYLTGLLVTLLVVFFVLSLPLLVVAFVGSKGSVIQLHMLLQNSLSILKSLCCNKDNLPRVLDSCL